MKTRILIIIAIFLAGFYYAKNEKQVLTFIDEISVTHSISPDSTQNYIGYAKNYSREAVK